MMSKGNTDMCNNQMDSLLMKFNHRDRVAYCEVYSLLYKRVYLFTEHLYHGSTLECEDTIQDVFVEIWENKDLEFISLEKIQAYLFVAIKHKYLNYVRHQKFKAKIIEDDDNYYVAEAVDAEVNAVISASVSLLPDYCAESFKLFMEGYTVKDVAQKLEKPITTIYSQREKARRILGKYLDKIMLVGFF